MQRADVGRGIGQRRHLVLQPQARQRAGGIGGDGQTGAHLTQFRRLFEDRDRDAQAPQGSGRCHAADTGADECDLQ